jgi:predicted AAA+ superfamily ATPase
MWRMLALDQGCPIDLTKLASNLSISTTTVRNYLDTLIELFLIRELRPWHGNSKKRLVKTPKIYVRDSGVLHSLAGIKDFEDLCGHPLYGMSWEGFVIEQILQRLPFGTEATYYRTSAGAEIDLVLETPRKGLFALEIKRTVSPKISKGFHLGCAEIQPKHRYFVVPTQGAFPLDEQTEAIGVEELLERLE